MSEDTEKSKWDFVEKRLAKKEQQLPQSASNPLAVPIEGVQQPKGIVETWKSSKIERQQRIEMLTEKTKGQLEVWKHHVEGQVVVAKKRIDLHVVSQLEEITRQHLTGLR